MPKTQTVVISTLNSQYIHSSLSPWCLLAGIRAYGGEGIIAHVAEGTINEDIGAVADRIVLKKPDVVCFCCYIWNIAQTLELVCRVKTALPNAVVALGGPEVSYNAKQVLLENLGVDYILSGEGERSLALLLNALRLNADVSHIPGLCCRRKNELCFCEPKTPGNDPPSPYLPEYFEALSGRIAYLETSRGCPYSCAFCLSGRRGGVRYFDLCRVKKEILMLVNSGTKTVKFVDRTFNANKSRAREIWAFIIDHIGKDIPKTVRFHFEIAGDLLDQETLELLQKAPEGSMQVEIGLQSFNSRTLESVHRKTDMKALRHNVWHLATPGNIHIHIDLIAGLPHEDWESFAQSFNTAYALAPHMLQLGFLKLLHGAPMREFPEQFPCEYNAEPPYEVVQTPWLSRGELQSLHRVAHALDRLYNSGRFRRTHAYILKSTGIAPFELFHSFGDVAFKKQAQSLSLDEVTELVLKSFSGLGGVDSQTLRDMLVCDRLATDSSGFIPKALRVEDPMLRQVKAALKSSKTTKKQDGVKRSVAILYAFRQVVCVDYRNQNPVTGEYELKRIPWESVIGQG